MAKNPSRGRGNEIGNEVVGRANLENIHKENRYSPTKEWELVKMKEARKTRGEIVFLGLTVFFAAISIFGISSNWSPWFIGIFFGMMTAAFAALTRLHMINVDKWIPNPSAMKLPWSKTRQPEALPADRDPNE